MMMMRAGPRGPEEHDAPLECGAILHRRYSRLPRTRRRTAAGERGSSSPIPLTMSRMVLRSSPPATGAPSHSWVRDRTSSWSMAMLSRAADPERPSSPGGPSRTGLACSAHPADPNAKAQRTINVRMVDLMADRTAAGDDLDHRLLDTRRGSDRPLGSWQFADGPPDSGANAVST
jgi:hypothetical protein